MNNPYCDNLFAYKRFRTREVNVGSVGIGGNNPIRVQSMTTVDTMDTEASIAESIRMIEAGCEIVRLTAPSKKDAENLKPILDGIRSAGHTTPLVADIHFTPNAAEIAATIVEKVRVNPGNYADKKKFEELSYTDESYQIELDRIRERFTPLVEICKKNSTAIRIGTNHGSLSDRILGRYGDTPLGMVESAMEFITICRELDFHDIIISMKASNTRVMVQAYRLLLSTMIKQGMNYPLHLGVTEAGEGEDGRIKSAVGIGTLLEDGLGDTIRVSLTEAPEKEIPVAKLLLKRYQNRDQHSPIKPLDKLPYSPYEYSRRFTNSVNSIGGDQVPAVVCDLSNLESIKPANLYACGYTYSVPTDKWTLKDQSADLLYLGGLSIDFDLPGMLGVIQLKKTWQENSQNKDRHYPLFDLEEYSNSSIKHPEQNFVILDAELDLSLIENLRNDSTVVLVLETSNLHAMPALRAAIMELMNAQIDLPVIIKRTYSEEDSDSYQLYSSTDFGGLLLDGLGNGVWSVAPNVANASINSTLFGILQASRTRISKTEYISCPSCGRTLFDLQETTAKIRAKTEHLKGVKIGIMGCIVNGPGEMADADFGYVGTGPGKITLYKEKEVVQRNIPEIEAVDALINLIKEHGDWVEPSPK